MQVIIQYLSITELEGYFMHNFDAEKLSVMLEYVVFRRTLQI